MEILLNIDNYEALESNNFVFSTIEKNKGMFYKLTC